MTDETKVDLNAQHPDYPPGITYGDVEKAKEKARKKIEAERRADMIERITEEEEVALRAAMGETERQMHELATLKGGAKELVDITLNLAPQHPDIRIDGVIYANRGTYSVTRAKAADMLKIQWEGWNAESIRLGQDKYAFYGQMDMQRNSVVVNKAGALGTRIPRGTH